MMRCHCRVHKLIGFIFLVTLFGTLAVPGPVLWAQQAAEADVLVAQAVLAYDEENYDKSLDLLNEALTLDPQDPRGLFYKGLVFLAQNRARFAIEPLERALKIRPDDLYVRYHLGVAYLNSGQYEKAVPLLETVFAQEPTLDNLGYYVALSRYQKGEVEEARKALAVNQSTESAMAFRVQELNNLLSGEDLSGRSFPLAVVPPEPFTHPSAQFRNMIPGGFTFAEGRRLRFQVSLGGYYDDNVAINPDPTESIPVLNPPNDPNATITNLRQRHTSAPGFLASLRADYAFYRDGPFEAVGTYSFLQTLNGEALEEFNIQDHLVGISTFYRDLWGEMPFQLAAQYTYDYYFLDMTAFLARHTPSFSATLVGPVFDLPIIGSIGNVTTGLYRYQIKTFFREPADRVIGFSGNSRDAFNNMLGVSHAFLLTNNRILLRIGYQFDNESADGSPFSYEGHRLLTGGQATLPWGLFNWGDIILRYDYDIHWRYYKDNQTFAVLTDRDGLLRKRRDFQHTHLVQLVQPLPNNFSFALQYQGIRNESRVAFYDYSKNVFLGTLTWTY